MINNLGLYNITIDFDKMFTHTTTNIYFKENDINTSKVNIQLVKSGSAIDLTGTTVSVEIETAIDNITDSATIIDAENGIIEYTFPTNALIEGINFFELILTEGENIKVSPRMAYKVLDSINDEGAVESETNYPVLLQLISDTNVVINNANQAIVNIEDKIVDVEARTIAKENEVNNKIIEANEVIETTILAKDGTILATNNANTKIVEAENKIVDVENRFQALTASQQQDAEVIDMRTGVDGKVYASAKARVDAIETKPSIIYSSVEGPYISTDSIDGWVKNVQILGNTYQDPNSLAIKSTGNKLSDGRFEIPLLCTGKNLADPKNILVDMYIDGATSSIKSSPGTRSIAFKVKKNTDYIISFSAVVNRNMVGLTNSFPKPNDIVPYLATPTIITTGKVFKFNTGNYAYATFYYNNVDITVDIQLEEGTVATSYESYKENKLTILSDYQIGKIGTVADRIVQLSDGKWYIEKNDGIKYVKDLNVVPGATYTNTIRFVINNLDNITNYDIMCNLFPTKPVADATIDSESITARAGGFNVNILKTKLATQDISGFYSYAISNNMYIKYPLATPVYYPLPDDQQIVLRAFNNKTNISFLTEIEGTIKCDVPKSTSASVNAITEKVNAIDKDLERVKKLEDATNSTVVTDKDFCVIEDTANGYLSDFRLEGRTLVNLGGKIIPTVVQGTFSNIGDVYRATKGDALTYLKFALNITPRVVGKKITVVIKDYKESVVGSSFIKLYNRTTSTAFGAPVYLATYYSKGYVTFDIPSTFSSTDSIELLIYTNGVTAVDWVECNCNILILEGEQTPPNGYFEGLKSVGQDANKIVVSSVKADGNLLNLKDLTFNDTSKLFNISSNSVSYKKTNEGGWGSAISTLKNIIVGETYYFSSKIKYNLATTSQANIKEKNLDGSNSVYIVTNNGSFTVKSGKVYELALLGNATSNIGINVDCEYYDLCLNKGTTPITYRPYETDKKEILYLDTVDSTWKKPVFRGIWNNGSLVVCDTVEKHANGKYYYHKRTSEYLLKGTENWVLQRNNGTVGRFVLLKTDLTALGILPMPTSIVLSNRFSTILSNQVDNYVQGMFIANNDGIVINELLTKYPSSAELKSDFVANNVTIVYQLAQEQVYECTPIDVASYNPETNYLIESGVLSPRSTIRVQNYIGEIINNLKEQVSVLQNKVYKENITMMTMLLNHEARLIAHSI